MPKSEATLSTSFVVTVTCWTTEHWLVVTELIVLIPAYVIGIPIGLSLALYKAYSRDRLRYTQI